MTKKLISRTTVRHYLNKKIEQSKIKSLISVINNSPSSMNIQGFSAIFVTDNKIKRELSKLNFNQKHVYEAPLIILFCADYNLIDFIVKKEKLKKVDYLNYHHFLISVIDATIAATHCEASAIDMGLGTCFLGGIRQNLNNQIMKILKIKGKCFPILGLAIGYPVKNNVLKPKINKVFINKYREIKSIPTKLDEYDNQMKKFYKSVFNIDKNFSEITAKSLNSLNCNDLVKKIKKYFFNKIK